MRPVGSGKRGVGGVRRGEARAKMWDEQILSVHWSDSFDWRLLLPHLLPDPCFVYPQIISSLKNAGFIPPHTSRSGLNYDPLNHWTLPERAPSPSRRTTPSQSPGVPIDTTRSEVEGPALGFPGLAMGLPPIGDRTRADACLSNGVFADPQPSPPADLLWDTGNERDSAPGNTTNDVGYGRTKMESARGKSTMDGRTIRGGVIPPKVFTLSVRGARVEFPFLMTVSSGSMEHDDVIRWLRRFRGALGLPGDGGGEKRLFTGGKVEAKLGGPKTSGPAWAGQAGDVRGPPDIATVPWACQYVEAREFELNTVIAGQRHDSDGGGIAPAGDKGRPRVLPDLSCAISRVVVSTAGYLAQSGGNSVAASTGSREGSRDGSSGSDRGGSSRVTGLHRGDPRQPRPRVTATEDPVPPEVVPPSVQAGFAAMKEGRRGKESTVRVAKLSTANAAAGGVDAVKLTDVGTAAAVDETPHRPADRVGAAAPAGQPTSGYSVKFGNSKGDGPLSPKGRREAGVGVRRGLGRKRSSASLSVLLGGTRHDPNSRKRYVHTI